MFRNNIIIPVPPHTWAAQWRTAECYKTLNTPRCHTNHCILNVRLACVCVCVCVWWVVVEGGRFKSELSLKYCKNLSSLSAVYLHVPMFPGNFIQMAIIFNRLIAAAVARGRRKRIFNYAHARHHWEGRDLRWPLNSVIVVATTEYFIVCLD